MTEKSIINGEVWIAKTTSAVSRWNAYVTKTQVTWASIDLNNLFF